MITERYNIIDYIDNDKIVINIPKELNPMSPDGFKSKFRDNNSNLYSVASYHISNNILILKNYSDQKFNSSKWVIKA